MNEHANHSCTSTVFVMAVIMVCSLAVAAQPPESTDTTHATAPIVDTMPFEHVFILGLQGDASAALVFLDTLDGRTLTPRQRDLKAKFYARFRAMDETPQYATTDTAVISLLDLYRDYWRASLLDNTHQEKHDNLLTDAVIDYLLGHSDRYDSLPPTDLRENFPDYLQQFLMQRGVYAATGKTGSLFDLLLHTSETEHVYTVATPEERIDVKVVFMDSIVSNGWEEYATFGKYYPGGWATSDALYCVAGSYDLESENFTVSYLKHEGKHFADYKKFPELSGPDLEYRAKLVELSAAEQRLQKLLSFFLSNSSDDRSNPHGFANRCVMRDLSLAFGRDSLVTDRAWWQTQPADEIHRHAVTLLKKNTAALMRAGADTVSVYIE